MKTFKLILISLIFISLNSCEDSSDDNEDQGYKVFMLKTTDIYNTTNVAGYSTQSVSNYRSSNNLKIRQIIIMDDYQGTLTVRLYHPDAPDRIFNNWIFNEGDELYLVDNDSEYISIGSDWGIQVVFGNGVSSDINFVGDVPSQM